MDIENGRKRKRNTEKYIYLFDPRVLFVTSVVKGRSIGSVCTNSCELTAYIGLPFCFDLALSCRTRFLSIPVHLYSTCELNSVCSFASSYRSRVTEWQIRLRLAIQTRRGKKKKRLCVPRVHASSSWECMYSVFVYNTIGIWLRSVVLISSRSMKRKTDSDLLCGVSYDYWQQYLTLWRE